MSDKLFSGPNWPGGPLTCRAAHLPAFESPKALNAFAKEYCPSGKAGPIWQCRVCRQFHCDIKAPDPAGASSGSGRSSKGDHDNCPFCSMPVEFDALRLTDCPTCLARQQSRAREQASSPSPS
jgi:hypothetical protein